MGAVHAGNVARLCFAPLERPPTPTQRYGATRGARRIATRCHPPALPALFFAAQGHFHLENELLAHLGRALGLDEMIHPAGDAGRECNRVTR
jgi:hypothetical protein